MNTFKVILRRLRKERDQAPARAGTSVPVASDTAGLPDDWLNAELTPAQFPSHEVIFRHSPVPEMSADQATGCTVHHTLLRNAANY
jgi:hypothetical protein